MPSIKSRVIIFGTFDIFHEGHKNLFKQARKHGDYLIVVVARDQNVEKIKGQRAKNNEKKRVQVIRQSGLADKVILGNVGKNRYKIIEKYAPQVIGVGYDQQVKWAELREKLLEFGLKNVKIKRLKSYKPEIYKSSKLKRQHSNF